MRLSVFKHAANQTISTTLSGAGEVVWFGPANLTLTGNNSHTGGLQIGGGTVTANHGNAPGWGPISVAASGKLKFVASGQDLVTGEVISGAGTVEVADLGLGATITTADWNWTGFTGVLSVGPASASGAGRLHLPSATHGSMSIDLGVNSTLSAAAFTFPTPLTIRGGTTGENEGQLRLFTGATWSGPITVTGTTASPSGTFGCSSGTATIGSAISGTVGISKIGAGTIILSTSASLTGLTGGVELRAGGLRAELGTPATATNTFFGTNTVTLLGGTLNINSSTTTNTATWDTPFVLNGGALTFTEANHVVNSLSIASGVTGTVNPATASRTVTVTNALTGTGVLSKTGSGTLVLSAASPSWSGGCAAGSGTLRVNNAQSFGTGTITLSGGSIDSGTSNLVLTTNNPVTVSANTTFVGTQSLTFGTGTWTIGAARTITTTANTLTLGGIISGAFTLTKAGAGTLALSADGSTMSAITVSAGTLRANLNTTAGARTVLGSGTITVNSGATCQFFATSTSNAMSHTNGFTLSGGTLVSEDANQTFSGNITLTAATTSTINVVWANKNCTLSGIISGSGNLAKTSNGTVILTGVNTFSGTLAVNNGVVSVNTTTGRLNSVGAISVANSSTLTFGGTANTNALGSTTKTITVASGGTLAVTTANAMGYTSNANYANVVLNGGTFNLAADQWINNLTLGAASSALTGTGKMGFYAQTGDAVTANFAATISNGVTFYSDTGVTKLHAFNVATGVTLTMSGAFTNSSGNLGTNGVTKSGLGTLVMSGASTYAGATDIQNGTLQLTGSLNSVTALNLGNGTNSGKLILGDATAAKSQTVAGLTTTGTGTTNTIVGGGNASNSTLTVNLASGTNAFAGVIGGAGVNENAVALVKDGAGTLALSKTNTYTGGTTVSAGVLDLTAGGGSAGTIRGTVSVAAGAQLKLSVTDALGYATDGTRVSTLNLNGATNISGTGTLHINTTANETLGSATVNLTGASITGIASSNLDFFAGSSALNSLASATTSTVSGTKISIRQNAGLTITVADGAASPDMSIDSVIASATGFTTAPLIKAGLGSLTLSGVNTYSGGLTVNAGLVTLANASAGGTNTITINSGGTLTLGANITNSITLNAGGTLNRAGFTCGTVTNNGGTDNP